MHILLIHNNYGVYSGEEAMVDRQIVLFRELGHLVSEYRRTTNGSRNTFMGNIKGFVQGFYSVSAVRDIKKILRVSGPDIVMVHNLFPFISPAILKPIRKAGIPIIMTVHNFRLICPTGLFMREAKPCELCLQKGNEWNCMRYNCEQSVLKSFGYAGRNCMARLTKAYISHVDIYACITRFQITKLVEAGYSLSRMKHIPNFAGPFTEPLFALGEYIAVSGRISKEKGIDIIIGVARQTLHIKYVFAGTIRKEDESLIKDAPANCVFLGHLSSDNLAAFYKESRFLLMASRWYEGFPTSILDASMHGKPAIVPAHGGFIEVVDDQETGLHFIPGNAESLRKKVEYLWNNPAISMQMGKNAYRKLTTNYTADVIKDKWKNVLEEVINP